MALLPTLFDSVFVCMYLVMYLFNILTLPEQSYEVMVYTYLFCGAVSMLSGKIYTMEAEGIDFRHLEVI